MGCFNTKGFFSGIDIEDQDKAFVLICTQSSNPIIWTELETNPREHKYNGRGTLDPISFPIFGEYDDYGQLENIVHDFNVEKIESKLEDTIENILNVLYNVTVFPHYLGKEQINKYTRYKEKLGLIISEEKLEQDYFKFGINNKMTIQKWIDLNVNSLNQELLWTMDHTWVYTTLGKLYKIEDSIKTTFRRIWGNEIYEHQKDIENFLSFTGYLDINNFQISNSYPSGQDVEWKDIKRYTDALCKFIDKKIEDN